MYEPIFLYKYKSAQVKEKTNCIELCHTEQRKRYTYREKERGDDYDDDNDNDAYKINDTGHDYGSKCNVEWVMNWN